MKILTVSAKKNPAIKSAVQFWVVSTIDSIYFTTGKYAFFTVKLILENSDIVLLQQKLRCHSISGLELYVVKTWFNITTTVELVDRQILILKSKVKLKEVDLQLVMLT